MTNTPTDIPSVATSLYTLLQPLQSEDRKRVIKAALTMLGDDAALGDAGKVVHKEIEQHQSDSTLPVKVTAWMKKYDITEEQLGHVFHLGSNHEVIAAEAPGSSSKQQTINAYVLTGISAFLSTGEVSFEDESARKVCKAMGCFNVGNHSAYMRDKGNVLGGSKEAGWTLTGPGLKSGADLIKGLVGN